MKTDLIVTLARRGAAIRLEELQDEIQALREFVEGKSNGSNGAGRRGHLTASTPTPVKQRRKKMSPAARKAISDAQKARWAVQKAKASAKAARA